jgi:hypothetical protein
MQWRNMTAAELATRPEARLGGALLAIDIVAVLLCALVLTGLIVALDELRSIGGRYMIAVAFITLWAAAFVVMTWLRLSATPLLTGVGLIAWIIYRAGVSVIGGYGWPLAVDLLAELAMASAFCGYMASGVRPNAYYRRRLPAP